MNRIKNIETNLPKRVVASPLMGIEKELLSGATWPELIWKLKKDLCVHHHITFLYRIRFPSLFPRQKK